MISVWWLWGIAALVLIVLEMLVPSYVFLGFAGGAVATGLLLLIGGPFAGWMNASVPLLMLFFAVMSLVSWLVLRRVLGPHGGSVKTFSRDINDD